VFRMADFAKHIISEEGRAKHLRVAQSFALESIRSEPALDTIDGTIAGRRPRDAREHALYCEAVSELARCLEGQHNSLASSRTVDTS
jgi:hypothetical protein